MTGGLRIVPANEASWEDLQAVFGTRGVGGRVPVPALQAGAEGVVRLVPSRGARVPAAHPDELRSARVQRTTSGLVAYRDGIPVGWCAVEPRTAYAGLLRVFRTPWDGRHEDKTDDSIWAVTCVFARVGYRRQGISHALGEGGRGHSRAIAAPARWRPTRCSPSRASEITWGEMLVGSRSIYAAAGMTEVSRPSPRRAVMRIDFTFAQRSICGRPWIPSVCDSSPQWYASWLKMRCRIELRLWTWT